VNARDCAIGACAIRAHLSRRAKPQRQLLNMLLAA
jgi:hypothetical protein